MKVTIIGGGAVGLALAYFLAKAKYEVALIEKSSDLGGLLATDQTRGDDIEFFYHHFFTHDIEINWLLKDLGIDDRIHYSESSMGFFSDGQIYPFSGAIDLLKFSPLKFHNRIKFGLSSIAIAKLLRWQDYEDISAIAWIRKTCGPEIADKIWGPMLKVKFGTYFDQVPLSWLIGRLKQRFTSRKGGKEMLGYLSGSLKTLVTKLETRLLELGVTIYKNVNIRDVTETKVATATTEIPHNKVVLTIGNPLIDNYLTGIPETEYFAAVCVVLFLKKALGNLYWLNIADAQLDFGGIIEHTNLIPSSVYNNEHIVYISKYIAKNDPLYLLDNEALKDRFISQISKVYRNYDQSDLIEARTYRSNSAAIVIKNGYSSQIPHFNYSSNIKICNMSHIYPDERSVNNCIRIAHNAAVSLGSAPMLPAESNSLAGLIGF